MSLSNLPEIVEESTKKLLRTGCSAARYWTLVDVEKRERDDPLVVKTIGELRSYPRKLKILSRQLEDGTWPISAPRKADEDSGPGPPFGWTYITMLRNLQELGDYYTETTDGHIAACLEKIIGWQNEEGYIPGPFSGAYPNPYYNSFALRDLWQYEMGDDPRVRKLQRWLFSMQRPDGGWIMPKIQDMRYKPPYGNMRMRDFIALIESEDAPAYDPSEHHDVPSCIWCTMMAVRALSWTPAVKTEALKHGAEFFLDRFFQRNYHPSYYQSEKNWTTLRYPTYLGSGLIALDILTYMGYDLRDDRMVKPVEWLVNERSRDGLWHLSDRPQQQKDMIMSSTVLTVLSRVAGSV